MNAKYYWRVSAEKDSKSAVHTFRTEDQAPRLMHFPSVRNVRDLGGRKAMNGKRVKQNLVFCTAGMNYNVKKVKSASAGTKVREVKTRHGVEKTFLFLENVGSRQKAVS